MTPGRGLGLWTLLAALVVPVAAQPVALRGRVTDADDGRALPGATVHLTRSTGERFGTATSSEGSFLLPRLPRGRYLLRVTFVGYVPFADSVTVEAVDEAVSVALRADTLLMDEVTVRDAVLPALPGEGRLVSVRAADVASVPTLTPASDLAAYLFTLPAFTATGEQGGQVSVRGGEPTQNLFLVDGIPVYQPFHVLGEVSVVPGDALAVADVYAGAFPARHGGRMASVVDVALRSGNKHTFEVRVSAAPLLSAVQVEGPLLAGKVSALLSARTSFVDRVGAGFTGQAQPFRFGDRLGKLHAYLTQTATLSLTALQSDDRARLRTAFGEQGEARWATTAVGLRFTYLPTTFAVLAEVDLFGSRLDSAFDVPQQLARRSLVEEGGANFGFRYLMGRDELRFGMQARTNHLLTTGELPGEEYLTEGAVYLDGVAHLGALRVDPGLRLSTFPSRSRVVLEPRLRVEWARGGHRLHGGVAVVHQEIGGRYTSDDLSDVFVAWVPTPAGAPLPRAEQVVVGWAGNTRRTLVALEAYHRRLHHIGVEGATAGRAQGVEARAERYLGAFVGRLGAAWQSVRYTLPGGEAFAPPPDRPLRLDAQLVARQRGWEASARWFFVDGAAFTPLRGAYRDVPVVLGSTAHLTDPGRLRAVDGTRGSRRLPPSHRLDLALAYRHRVGPLRVMAQVALRNAYDRRNLFYLNRLTGDRYDALPRTLAVGLRVEL